MTPARSYRTRFTLKAQTGLRTFAVVALSRVLWDLLQRWRGAPVESRCPKKLQVELQASAEELNMAKSELETWQWYGRAMGELDGV